MLQRTLGHTGWKVGVIGFGGWGIGGQWGPVEEATAVAAVRAAADAGVTFFDTADAYGEPPGLSEELIGRALQPVRDQVRIATKAGNWARRFGQPLPFTHYLHVVECCHASLHRLRTDRIDLFQCHLGEAAAAEVFLEAFDRLAASGKIGAYGVSTGDLDAIRAFHRDRHCAAVQLDYSLLSRKPERELLPFCAQNGIGVVVRGPLAKGILTGKFTKENKFSDGVRKSWNEGAGRERFLHGLEVVERLRPFARPDRTLAQFALQFVLAHPAVTVAIPGAKSPEQARANAAAGGAVLQGEELEQARRLTAEV